MADIGDSGIFYIHHGSAPLKAFPGEFKRGLLSRIEPRFTLIFLSILLVAGSTVWILSHVVKIKEEVSDRQIVQIQERYAQLVLNQPKPKEEEKPVEEVKGAEEGQQSGSATAKKEEVKVDREKESFVQREQRRAAASQDRAAVRARVAQQIQSTGIFAAITAAGSSGPAGGGNSKVTDLLGGVSDGLASLGSISVSKGTFTTRNVDPAELGKKREGRATGEVGIQRQEVGNVAMNRVASAGSVNITTEAPPEVTGESATQAERSQAAIQRVVNREQLRLKRVYEDWLKRDPALAGRLTVKFTILPSGTVANVSIIKTTTNNSDFDETIVRYIKRWEFPPVPGGSEVEVVYPFVFEGQA